MKQIYNKETKVADLIEDTATPPEGWTAKAPNWVMYEAWDYTNDCWGVSFELMKDKKRRDIKNSFEQQMSKDSFMSETIGIEVDCRRNASDNDIQNVQGLIDDYDNLKQEEKYYVGVNDVTQFPLTLEELIALKIEMSRYGRKELYKKKWMKESEINACNTKEELDSIKW